MQISPWPEPVTLSPSFQKHCLLLLLVCWLVLFHNLPHTPMPPTLNPNLQPRPEPPPPSTPPVPAATLDTKQAGVGVSSFNALNPHLYSPPSAPPPTPHAATLDTKHAGVGVSIFNAVGAAIGGFIGPYSVGAFVQRTGSFVSATIFMGLFLLAAGVLMTGLGIFELIKRRRGRRLLRHALQQEAGVGRDAKAVDEPLASKRGTRREVELPASAHGNKDVEC